MLSKVVIDREELLAKLFEQLENRTSSLSDGSWRKPYYERWCTDIGTFVDTFRKGFCHFFPKNLVYRSCALVFQS